jgi:hypothetical protein
VTREPGTQDFDRDGPFQSQIACFVHLAYPAVAEVGDYFVSAKVRPDGQTWDREERSELQKLCAKNRFRFCMSQQFKNLVPQGVIATARRQDKRRSFGSLSTQGSVKDFFNPTPIL